MGVVDDGRGAVRRPHELEASARGVQRARRAQHFRAVEAQQYGRAVDREQVVGVETAYEPDPYLLSVDAQQHAVDVHLDDFAAEVRHCAQRIGVYGGGRVLHHHAAVAVVDVCQGESLCAESVEEEFLGADVFGEGLVVVEVVVRDVREDAAREVQAPRAFLYDGVRRTLHETVFAPLVGHLPHHGVQPHGVGCGVRRFDGAVADFVDHRRNQPGLVAQRPHQIVEQRHGRGLAVGAGDAHEFQFAARVAVESRRHVGQRPGGVGNHGVGYPVGRLFGQAFADHRRGAFRDGGGDEIVAVALRAAGCEEAVARAHGARVVNQSGDGGGIVAVQRLDGRILQEFFQCFHKPLSLRVRPCGASAAARGGNRDGYFLFYLISTLWRPSSPGRCVPRPRCFGASRRPGPRSGLSARGFRARTARP